jgi:hypothetical protein
MKQVAMRWMFALFAVCVLSAAAPCVQAWGYAGHEVVGVIADRMLTQNARMRVQTIAGMSLQSAGKWADCVKGVVQTETGAFKYEPEPQYRAACVEFEAGGGIARMEDYVKRNWNNCSRDPGSEPCHRQYHYTDVAIQHDSYERAHAGTRDHDIVYSVRAAIAVLQGKAAPPPYGIQDSREALLMLAHFIGDLHQPLHVGAIYLDNDGQPINPDAPENRARADTSTRGGNWINTGSTNLHALWDAIPSSIAPGTISDRMHTQASAVARTSGELASWPVQWATESLKLSKFLFANMKLFRDPNAPDRWFAEFNDPRKAMSVKAAIQARQLTRAGARLAHVLNTIWP